MIFMVSWAHSDMSATPPTPSVPVSSILDRPIVFVSGKGGVGKTSVSQAIAQARAEKGRRTLWVGFEDPTRPPGELRQVARNLQHLNCDAELAFREYMGQKLRFPGLAGFFTGNPVIKFLAKAGPGVHELVLLGKLWFEREHYDCIVADLPSTGYGLAMFQSIDNWSRIFQSGPLYRDAAEMLATFSDPVQTGQLIVALPEEMPLRESLELGGYLNRIFPKSAPGYIVNRRFVDLRSEPEAASIPADPSQWRSPLADSLADFALKRSILEAHNLRIWDEAGLTYSSLAWELPGSDGMVEGLCRQLEAGGHL